MKVFFGENLKRLRTEHSLTQKVLADYLGVSFQTISKWENGETYPDITLLPLIADYFDVTVDELISANHSVKEQEIKTYLERFDNMQLNEVSSVLAEYETAVKEFPNEFSMLINYMELLHIEKGSVPINDYKPLSDKLIAAYEKIQKHCTDDSIRIRAKRIMLQHLMWQYECLGWFDSTEQKFDEKYKNRALEILDTLPSMCDSREYLSLCVTDIDNERSNKRNAIEELSYLLQNVIIGYCYYDDAFSPQYIIDVIRHMNGIFQMIDSEDNPSKNRIFMIYNNGHLGHFYAAIGDNENALKYLRLAAEQAVAFDKLPELEGRTALFYEQEKYARNMNMSERMYELMTKHYPLSEEFRASLAFKNIISILKN